MKNLGKFSILFILFSFMACTESDVAYETIGPNEGDEGDPNTSTAQLEADIDEVHFSAVGVTANLYSTTFDGTLVNLMNILGTTTSETVSLQFSTNGISVGSVIGNSPYSSVRISDTSITNPMEVYDSNDLVGDNESDAMVTITEFNPLTMEMSGTFSATLYHPQNGSSKNITNGVFTNITPESSLENGLTYNGFVNFNSDGSSYGYDINSDMTGTSASLHYFNTATENRMNLIIMNLQGEESKVWVVYFPFDVANGTYELDGMTYSAAYTVMNSNTQTSQNFQVVQSGSITITNNANGLVSGEFEFVLQDDNGNAVTVESGEFSYQY